MDEDDHLSFCYTSGKKSRDAGAWLFDIYGKRSGKPKWGMILVFWSSPYLCYIKSGSHWISYSCLLTSHGD